jgi:hypothetical protein
MEDAVGWRRALAERIATSYASNSNAQAVMVAGSVGRGTADRYSDIEIDVYYAEAPTEAERIAAVKGCGGTVLGLAEDEYEWEEQMSFGDFPAHTSTFLVETMDRYLRDVVDECSVAPQAQSRLFSLQHGVTVKGDDLVERWRAKAEDYPEGLQKAMFEEHLTFEPFRYGAEMLARRDDLLSLYETLVDTGRRLLAVLLALNRVYLPTPDGLKSMDETIGLMEIKPASLAARLREAFRGEPAGAVTMLEELIEETLALVDAHVRAFDTTPYRTRAAKRRRGWDTPPR